MLRPNAVVIDGVKDLGDSVIYLCHIKIGQALVGRFEGLERSLKFHDDVNQKVIVGVSYWLQRTARENCLGC